MPPPETYESEIGSQSRTCQVYTWCLRLITRAFILQPGVYSRLEKPTTPLATQERLPRIYYT